MLRTLAKFWPKEKRIWWHWGKLNSINIPDLKKKYFCECKNLSLWLFAESYKFVGRWLQESDSKLQNWLRTNFSLSLFCFRLLESIFFGLSTCPKHFARWLEIAKREKEKERAGLRIGELRLKFFEFGFGWGLRMFEKHDLTRTKSEMRRL